MACKAELRVNKSNLKYGKIYGVTFTEAKKAYLSGMSKGFKRKVNVKFV